MKVNVYQQGADSPCICEANPANHFLSEVMPLYTGHRLSIHLLLPTMNGEGSETDFLKTA